MKFLWRSVFLLLALFISTASSYASTPSEKEIEAVRDAYLIATDGDERDVRRALKVIRQLDKKYPDNPLILTYRGGALSLRGKGIGKRPLDRMRETEEGLNIIDRALRRLPTYRGDYLEVVEAQLVATYVFINLPDAIFHRLREGGHLVKGLLNHPRFAEMPTGLQAAIYYAAAIAADKSHQPLLHRQYLELTLETDPNGKNSRKAELQLLKLPD